MTKEERLKTIAAAFEDKDDNGYFVSLYGTGLNYEKLTRSLDTDYKIILISGSSGTGKTFLLSKFHRDFKDSYPIFIYKNNDFTLDSLVQICSYLTNETYPEYDVQAALAKLQELNKSITIILDEAHLYPKAIMESVRVLSNEKFLKFIVAISKIEENSIFEDEQFESRVYEKIHLVKLEPDEVKHFVEEKLLLVDSSDYFARFDKKSLKLISKLTNGNIRSLNRLLNRVFTLLGNNISDSLNIDSKKINKYIEMAAIDLELLRRKWFFLWI